MERSSWLVHTNSKCTHKYPCKTEAEGDLTQKRESHWDQDRRAWSDSTTSNQRVLAATRGKGWVHLYREHGPIDTLTSAQCNWGGLRGPPERFYINMLVVVYYSNHRKQIVQLLILKMKSWCWLNPTSASMQLSVIGWKSQLCWPVTL